MAHVCSFIGDALICQMPHYVPMLSIDAVPGVLPHCEPLLYAHLLSTRLLNEKRAAFSQLAAVITPASLLADIVGLQPDQITEDAIVKSFGLDSLGGGRIILYIPSALVDIILTATRYSNQLIAHCEIQVSQIELLETMTVGMLNSMKATTWSEAQNDPEDTIYKDGSHLSRLLLDDTQHEGEHLYDPSLVAEVIAINKGGTTPRLFIVHDATGMTSPFLNLGLFLPNQICAIGDRQYGTSNGPSSIDSMAEHYISIIRAIQPHGPFVISGYSFGGIVALSIASKLANAGETVIRLILFDTYFVSGVRELESSYSFEWAQRVIDAVVAHFPPMSQEQEQELRVEIWKNTRLMSHHDPEFYDGPTTLVTPEDHSWYTGNAPLHVEWRQRLSNLDLKVSAGRHDTMFAAKHVETLAITLKDILSGM
jgi:thioesterase domain-containing protein